MIRFLVILSGMLMASVRGDCQFHLPGGRSGSKLFPMRMQEGDVLCKPVLFSTAPDFGERFQMCVNGVVRHYICNAGLRFDIRTYECVSGPAFCKNSVLSSRPRLPGLPRPPPEFKKISAPAPKTDLSPLPEPPRPQGPYVPECDEYSCKLPKCFCMGDSPKMKAADIPMMVMLSFDDAITPATYTPYFKKLLVDNAFHLRSPNGCPIKATFYSNYNSVMDLAKKLVDEEHEFASHTVRHILPEDASEKQIASAISGVRQPLSDEAGVPSDTVVGFRAPYLKLIGDRMFKVLKDNSFVYDSSITNIERSKGKSHLWPFTLDYPIPPNSCTNGPCPRRPFKGLWEIPLNSWTSPESNEVCGMIDACVVAKSTDDEETVKEKYLNFFRLNFQDFYTHKIPFHISTHGSMFMRNKGSFQALVEFLQEIQRYGDVWFLTPSQVIEWMRSPRPNRIVAANELLAWTCDN